MNVLIIEDSLTTAMTLETFVSACGHHPVCVPNAWLTWQIIEQWSVDLVLMDIMLPGVDGYELAARLRRRGFQAPIVAVTAMDDKPEQRQRSGVEGYIQKPVSMTQLKDLLEKYEVSRVETTSVN